MPGRVPDREELNLPDEKSDENVEKDCECVPYAADFETSGLQYHPVSKAAMRSEASAAPKPGSHPFRPPQDRLTNLRDDGPQKQETSRHDEPPPVTNAYSLKGRHHFSIQEPRGFSLSRSHRRSYRAGMEFLTKTVDRYCGLRHNCIRRTDHWYLCWRSTCNSVFYRQRASLYDTGQRIIFHQSRYHDCSILSTTITPWAKTIHTGSASYSPTTTISPSPYCPPE